MTTVRFFTEEQDDLPSVCIKTGQATFDCITLRLVYRPTWPILLLPLSLLATVVGVVAGARRTEVTLPLAENALRRYRQWWNGSVFLIFASGVGFIVASATHQDWLALAMALLFAAGGVTHSVAHMTLWCGFSLSKDCEVVTVRRCHRNFLNAMRSLNDRA